MVAAGPGSPDPGAARHGARVPDGFVPAATLLPVPHRPWSTLMLAVHTVSAALSAVGVVLAVVLVVVDLATRPAEGAYEPYGLVIAAVLAALGLPVGILSVVLAVRTRRARTAVDAGDAGPLRGVAVASLVVAGVGMVVFLAGGIAGLLLGVVLLVPYAGPSLGVLLAIRGAATPVRVGRPA